MSSSDQIVERDSSRNAETAAGLVRDARGAQETSYRRRLLLAVIALALIVAIPFAAGCSSSSSDTDTAGEGEGEEEMDPNALPIGATITLKSGLRVRVDSVQMGLANYDGSEVCCATITYENGNDSEESYNSLDWKAQDANGAQDTYTFFTEGENELSSGSLAPDGTVTGNLYFDGTPAKLLYYGNVFDDEPSASWIVE